MIKVSELKELLEGLDENARICFLPENSYYCEDIRDDFPRKESVNLFNGGSSEVYIIKSDGQLGCC